MSLFKKPSFLNFRNEVDNFHLLQTEMNRLFNNIFRDNSVDMLMSPSGLSLKVDLKETKDEFIIAADIPGAKKEDIEISFSNNLLSIRGERKFESEETDSEKSHIKERFYGKFERSFAIPENCVDKENIYAEMKNGELIVKLKKLPEIQREVKRIQIK